MRAMTIGRFLLTVGLAVAASGCCTAKTTPLFDPDTGKKIGAKNLRTGEYVLNSGWRLPASEVRSTRMSSTDANSEAKDGQKRLEAITQGRAVERRAINTANEHCWLMAEGGVGCFGCCGGDRCFESCWDYQYK